jgi:hypothetical protein
VVKLKDMGVEIWGAMAGMAGMKMVEDIMAVRRMVVD